MTTSAPKAPQKFDVAVLGAGPGGYVAAIRAAQLGLKVAIIERDNLGGVCLNWGCIPTKALIRNAEVVHLLGEGKDYGFSFDNLRVDYFAAYRRSRQVAERLVKGVEFLMRKNQITVIKGSGTLVGPNEINVENRGEDSRVQAEHIILATGARPRMLFDLVPDGRRVFTSRQMLEAQSMPKSLIVIGAGAIGMEFAYVANAYGCEVKVLEVLPRILPNEDEEVSAEVKKSFQRAGTQTLAGVKIESAVATPEAVTLKVNDGGNVVTMQAEALLVSAGVIPNTSGIGLETVGVALDKRGMITVDEHMATSVPSIYAIGDITGKLALAHVASAQGVVAADSIAARRGKYAGRIPRLDYNAIPRCTYTMPQVASMGLTEAQAREQGHKVKVSKFPLSANGKSLAMNNRDGFVKIVADEKYGELLGVHLVGPDVTELLPEFVLAKSAELTPEQIAEAVHAHPTLGETLMEAAHGIEGLPIHI
ncbi:MAG: dihydrolipoyl dehydrogenase [Thermoflexales bacterium]|nr:dihydrolipoyl dehydrogenase [Thermoflexales bacterium]